MSGVIGQAASAAGAACAHCGLPVPAGLVDGGRAEQFCCGGCETACTIIRGCGLEGYYRLRRESDDAAPAPVRTTAKRYGEFDDPVFRTLYARPLPGGLFAAELFLEGVHCAACLWLVERLPRVVPGVIEARLDLRRALVRIVWDEGVVPLSRVARALDSLGYPPHPARDAASRESLRREDRRALIRIAVAGACAGNVMLLALALYAGMFDTMEPQYATLFRWTSMAISLVSLAWPGQVFFRGAWAALRARTVHLDVPIALGLGAGGVWGTVSTIRGTGEIYFDSLSVLVLALLVGRWVQRRQARWSADAVELLFSLTPTSARLVEREEAGGERVRDVPIETVWPGDLVEVRAGDSIPVDGEVVLGASSIDQSLLSGESLPVEVTPGDRVSAGAVNLSGRLRVRVQATGADTRAGRLMRLVEEGTRRRAPIVRMADRIAGWFVAAMIGLAGLTLAVWLWVDPSRAVDHATALLIVTCPCGLGLATPLAVTVAVGRAARRGILIKGGDALERLSRQGTIFLDKTGTITRGHLSMVRWIGDESVRPLVAAVEALSSHPIAAALARDLGADPAVAATAEQTIGGGIEGTARGRRLVIGSPAFVAARVGRLPEWATAVIGGMTGQALTPVVIGVDGAVAAVAGLGDPIRPDAREAIETLRRRGWRVGILSGDHPGVVAAIASEVGLERGEARGAMTPEQKQATVEEARGASGRPVVMVGDGVNDAAALAAASVGIAVHGGAEASLAAADAYISRPGLGPVAELVLGSYRTIAAIRRNLVASLAYNATAAALAMTGVINPLIAAVLMPASSLTVVVLSLRSRTFGGRRCR